MQTRVRSVSRRSRILMFSRILLVSSLAVLMLAAAPCTAMQDLASYELPSAPVPEIRATMVTRPAALPRASGHHRLTLYKVSVAFLFASEALDSWTTYTNLTHPKWICGYSPAFGNAVTYISDDGKHYDPHAIQYDLCGPSPSGGIANYAYDVTRTGAFSETGWVTSIGLSSGRNAAGVIAWNAADDIGQMIIARYLAKRRGLLSRVAPGINFARGFVHLDCGIQNLQFARHHSDAGTWQFNLPNEAHLYPGPRWWGRR